MSNWETYYKNTKDYPPRSGLVAAMKFVKDKGAALDLGSGALNDAGYLIGQGFARVDAVDKELVAQEKAAMFPCDKFTYKKSTFEDYKVEPLAYDLINAQFSLPFIKPEHFLPFFLSVKAGLKQGGVLTGQFFGDRDAWNDASGKMTFETKEEAEKLLSDLDVKYFNEEENDKPTAAGHMKHWHIFHFIAVKP